ncbi:MAG TPA: hypothetical protein VGM25_06490 [Caulobacteraceae bacterium]|jgi:hypothetical protein
MNIKTGVLAAAAALALTVPAAALAQPYYGHDGYGRYETYRRDNGDWRRIERQRELRREEWRRLQWQREHNAYRGYGYSPYYR